MRVLVVFAALLTPIVAHADQSVVILKTKNALMYVKVVAGAKKVLTANMRVVELNVDGRPEEEIISQTMAAAPQVVLAIGPPAARIAKKAAMDLPIVYALVPSPKNLGLDERTGVSFAPDPKHFVELLQQALPQAKTLGLVAQPNDAYVALLKQAAQRANVQLVTRPASSDREIPAAVTEVVDHADAFLVLPDAQLVTTESFRFMAQATVSKRVPLLVYSAELLNVGATLALSPDYSDVGEKAAELVLHLLAGKPANTMTMALPEAIVDFNEKAAELLGKPIPDALKAKKGKRY